MWVVPPGSGLGWSEFKGAGHVEGTRAVLERELLSKDSGCPGPGTERENVGQDSKGGGEVRENRCCSRSPPVQPLPPRTAALPSQTQIIDS